jgi:hypothetical protein
VFLVTYCYYWWCCLWSLMMMILRKPQASLTGVGQFQSVGCVCVEGTDFVYIHCDIVILAALKLTCLSWRWRQTVPPKRSCLSTDLGLGGLLCCKTRNEAGTVFSRCASSQNAMFAATGFNGFFRYLFIRCYMRHVSASFPPSSGK